MANFVSEITFFHVGVEPVVADSLKEANIYLDEVS